MRLVTFLTASLFPLLLVAQENKKCTFYIQGGYRSSLFIKLEGKDGFRSSSESQHHKCIILNAGFQCRPGKNWRLGASFTYDHFGTKQRSVEFSNISYLVRCDRIWKEKKNYILYSGIGMGVTKTRRFEEERETGRKIAPGYHLLLAGVELRILRAIYLDANAGWGVCGILNMGAKLRF